MVVSFKFIDLKDDSARCCPSVTISTMTSEGPKSSKDSRYDFGKDRRVFLKRRPKNEDLRPHGLKRRPLGLKRRPYGLKRRPHGLKRRPHGLKRRPHGLKRLMLTAEGNARSRNLLRRFGNIVEFPLQYLVLIIKSIIYISLRFL